MDTAHLTRKERLKLSPTKLRAARVAHGFSVEDVASAASVSAATVTRAELGRNVPSADTLARMARFLDIPMEDLFDEQPQGAAAA